VRITSDGTYLISTCQHQIKGIHILTRKTSFVLEADTECITTWALKPDDTILISTDRNLMIYVWDLVSGTIIKRMRGHDQPILEMEFDPTGSFISTGASDGTIRVWDVEGGFCTHHFKGHRSVITALKFHSKKQNWMLFSASEDGQLRVWNLLEKSCLSILEGHMSCVPSLDISLCGNYLISAGRDKVVHVWNLTTFKLEKMIAAMESLETVRVISPDLVSHIVNPKPSPYHLYIAIAGEQGSIRLFDMISLECILTQSFDHSTPICHPITDMM
jgi:U3 small nucleolar RNA-associated protein 13